MRAILISTDQAFAAAFGLLLEPHGWSVEVLPNVHQATTHAPPGIADCVFLHAETIDATTVVQVRALVEGGFTRVFVAAPEGAAEWEERAYSSGATFVFAVPLRPQVFLYKLHNLLSAPAAAPQAPSAPQPQMADSSLRPAPLEVIRDFGRLLRHANDAETFVERYVSHLRELLGVNKVALYLASPGGDRHLRCSYATGVDAEIAHNIVLPLGSGIGLHATRNGVAITPNGSIGMDAMAKREMASLGAQLAIPVRDRENLLGILVLGPCIMGEPLGRDHVELLFMLMEDLGLVLRNARLHSELGRERMLFSSILEHMGVGCLVFDRDLALVHANKMAGTCFGTGSDRAGTFHALPNQLSSMIYEVVQGREARAEYVHDAKDGATYFVTVEPLTEEVAGKAAILVLAQNRTQVVAQQQAAIEQARRELLERMGNQFSHIFNNALTGVSTAAQLFPERRGSAEFLDETARVLPATIRKMKRHVDQIHLLGTTERESTETIPLLPVLEEAWGEALRFAEMTDGERLSLPYDRSLVVRATRPVLKALLFELLLNAIETKRGGDVVVSAERSGASQVKIRVEDQGPGFDDGALRHIGDEFVTGKSTGLGLGLAVVRKLLRELNGSLEIAGPGTKRGLVTITLPSPQ
jgi:signal transduction histidine kinase